MNSLIRIAEIDEDIAEVTNADGTLVAKFTPACNRAPAGTAALRAPAEPCEKMWEELEALHRSVSREGRRTMKRSRFTEEQIAI